MASNIPLWTELDAKARKSPLGPAYANALSLNMLAVDNLHAVEHLDDGTHNATEIPRTCGRVGWSGSAYGLEGFNAVASLDTGHNPTPGTLILTLASGFDAAWMVPMACSMSETGATKPCTVTAQVTSDTTVEFYQRYLDDPLGSGNTWDVEDASFSAAIYTLPTAPLSYTPLPFPSTKRRGDTLSESTWNALAESSAGLYARLLAEHSVDGEHLLREVPKAWAHVKYSGGTYVIDGDETSHNVINAYFGGTGQVELEFDQPVSTPLNVFITPDFPRSTGVAGLKRLYVACCPRSTAVATGPVVYLYAYDTSSNAWDRADCDFWVEVHGA